MLCSNPYLHMLPDLGCKQESILSSESDYPSMRNMKLDFFIPLDVPVLFFDLNG